MHACTHRSVCRLWLGGYTGLMIALAANGAWAQAGSPPPPAIAGLKAESATPLDYTIDNSAGTLTWLNGSFAAAAPGNPAESAYVFMEKHREAFKIDDPRAEFTVILSKKGQLVNDDHVYLEQRIKGIPVWGRRLGFHYDTKGRLYAVNGKYVATPDSALNTQPALTKEDAFLSAILDYQKLPEKGPASAGARRSTTPTPPPALNEKIPCKGELMFYPDQQGDLHLCYRVTFNVIAPRGSWVYFVDAVSGCIYLKYNQIMTAGPAVGSGLDLYEQTVSIGTYLDTDGQYKLINASKPMYYTHSDHPYTLWDGCIEVRDCEHEVDGNGQPVYGRSEPVVKDPDGDNVFTHGGSDPKSNYQPAVQLAYYLASVYDTYYSFFGRNSLDNKGLAMVGNIHVGLKFSNSMWDGDAKQMYFGDGGDTYWPESRSLDTVAHEATHGVTTYEIPDQGYLYLIEAGAINESHSDIGAVCNDYDEWLYGEEYHMDGKPSRRFDDPTLVETAQPKDMFDYYLMPLQVDGGGNHYNSGIGNHFFYQLAMRLPAESPAADGRFTAFRIAYRSYIYGAASPYSTFQQWGQYMKQAAVDLYGPGTVYGKVVEALNYVHIPQAQIGGHDNWQFKLDDVGQPYFFTVNRSFPSCWPVVSVRFDRPSANARLKTVAINFQNVGTCTYTIWYCGANADGSPNETGAQSLFSGISSSVIKTDNTFNNFKLTDSIAVATNFHIALDMTSGTYGGIRYDTGDPSTQRSWFKYMTYSGGIWYYTWYKTKEYFAIYPDFYPAGFDPTMMIKVIYEMTPLSAPAAPTLGSPANGETLNNWLVTFSWNAVSGADRYFLEVNSSPAWDTAARVYFATVTDTSKQVSGFPVGANYWRVYAGNADAWSSASETRSFTQLAPPPQLACSATALTPRAVRGQNAASQSFDVWNAGNGSISYSITENSDWLSVTPYSGASSGERNTIQVNYNASGLAAGSYTAIITVTASGAVGSPATIAVTLTVCAGLPVAADFDGDGVADPAMVDGSGNWYLWLSSWGYMCPGALPFSSAGAAPLAADFDGDAKADPAGVDASGNWTIRLSASSYLPIGPIHFSSAGSTPLAADFDGDRKADPAAMDSSGNWTICLSSASYYALGPFAMTPSGGTPVAADFDGDRKADPSVANGSGQWTICLSSAGYVRLGPLAMTAANRMAVAGDFDGDGLGDPTAVDSSGYWTICMSRIGYLPMGPLLFTVP